MKNYYPSDKAFLFSILMGFSNIHSFIICLEVFAIKFDEFGNKKIKLNKRTNSQWLI